MYLCDEELCDALTELAILTGQYHLQHVSFQLLHHHIDTLWRLKHALQVYYPTVWQILQDWHLILQLCFLFGGKPQFVNHFDCHSTTWFAMHPWNRYQTQSSCLYCFSFVPLLLALVLFYRGWWTKILQWCLSSQNLYVLFLTNPFFSFCLLIPDSSHMSLSLKFHFNALLIPLLLLILCKVHEMTLWKRLHPDLFPFHHY